MTKVDYEEAFDCVSWRALECVLMLRILPRLWISWAMSIVTSVKGGIILNNLSLPYLVILITNVLHKSLHQTHYLGFIVGGGTRKFAYITIW